MTRTTHVANAYDEDIYAKVNTGNTRMDSFEIGVTAEKNVSLKVNFTREFCDKNGFTCIAPDSYLPFDYDTRDNTVYVTIISKKGRVICSSYEITENRSVIVDKDGYVQRAMYKTMWQMGSSKVWTDMNGIEH